MGFPYHFVDLDEKQQLQRRHLLDSYGQFAQLSILLAFLVYQIIYGLRLLAGRWKSQHPYQPVKEHRSPMVSTFIASAKIPSSNIQARLRWALDDELAEGWGTKKVWLVAVIWSVWLFVISLRDTGDDYLHLTKRFGIVAASQLPLHYLLAFKAWSPVQYLTRLSHEELNPYHRFLGRIIIAFFCLHASMYLNFFVQKGILLKRIRDWDVILGLTAIATVLLIASTALAKVRTWNYRLFLNLHVILSVSLLPTLYLHVSHLRIYVLEAAALYVLLIIQRNISQASANATVKILPNTNLLFITIPLNKTLSAKTFTPGQHIYLGFPSLSQKLRINPFSIANPHPQTDKQIQLVARTLSGTTAILSTLAKGPQPTPLLIEGPYGSSAKFPDFANYDRILFIAGGVGATFTLPIYIDILQRAAKGEPMPATRFVWTVRKEADAQWGIDQLHYQLGKLPDIELHVSLSQTQISPNARREHHSSRRGREDVGAIEMQQAQTPNGILNVSSESANIARKGRPDLKTIVDHIFEHDSNDRVAVLVCGPLGMGKSLRRQIWGWVQKAREVFWHNEEFGW